MIICNFSTHYVFGEKEGNNQVLLKEGISHVEEILAPHTKPGEIEMLLGI